MLFIDLFAQACATLEAKTLIACCFDYLLDNQSLQSMLEYAVRFNDLNTLKQLQRTSIDFSSALISCSTYKNFEMAEYLLPISDPLCYYSYAWFCSVETNHSHIIELLQPHSHIVEAARHLNTCGPKNMRLIKNYIALISQTTTFGSSSPDEMHLARNCIQKSDLSQISLHSFSQPVLEACCVLALGCQNPTALVLVDALPKISLRLAQYIQNRSYRLFKYIVSHHKISMEDLNFLLEHSVYENKERDMLFLLRSGMNPQPTLDKWASYNPDCIDQLLKSKQLVDAEKQRKVLLSSTLNGHTNKERKI